MPRFTALLVLFLLAPILARAADVTITCQPPVAFTDNTPIPAGTAITFNLYAGSLLDTQPVCAFKRIGLLPNTYNYTATAVVNGVESDRSNTATVVVPGTPPPPPPVFATISTTVFMELQTPTGFGFLAVGTVPLGTPCDKTQHVNDFYMVPVSAVTFTTKITRLVALAACQ